MKIFITGQSGTGKTTVLKELGRRGYTTFNTDDMPGVSRFEIKATGEAAEWPAGYIDWSHYAWNWQVPAIDEILTTPGTIFVGAIVGNQSDYYALFDHFIVLTVDDDELYRRRTSREEQRTSDRPKNIRQSVARNQANIAKFIAAGATPIKNEGAIEEVADEILSFCGLPKVAGGHNA
jgi:adenylate kinase family enzyme